jgi:hypothetical protein
VLGDYGFWHGAIYRNWIRQARRSVESDAQGAANQSG